MNKAEFIKAIADQSGLSIKDAGAAFDAMTEVIAKTIKVDKIQLSGFGTFELKHKPAREGINPLTKQKIKIAASNTPGLKFGKSYKEKFN
ncbi:MAG TPA: HU family DNA-binding protein [Eubacteriales bacterium]|nr:HU family DNA-binding protein [Eubacteriales bacterium]